jgi:DNA invertase Pin-like site-specific DNA recombinase
MMKKAILYCRVSSDEQAVGYSLDYKEERLNDYCKKTIYSQSSHIGKTLTAKPLTKTGTFIER